MSGSSGNDKESQKQEIFLKKVAAIAGLFVVAILIIVGAFLAVDNLFGCAKNIYNAYSAAAAAIGILISTLAGEKLFSKFDDSFSSIESLTFHLGIFFLLIPGVHFFLYGTIGEPENCRDKTLESPYFIILPLVCSFLSFFIHKSHTKNQLNKYKKSLEELNTKVANQESNILDMTNEKNELSKTLKESGKFLEDLKIKIINQESKISNITHEKEELSKALNEKDQKKYIRKAAEMYQDSNHERVVTTMQKWLCAGDNADVLQEAFKEAKAGRIYFLGHIKPDINFVGVIWRLHNILNSNEPSKFRIYHLMKDDIYPLCIIGKRTDHSYLNGDLVLSINDYSPEGDIRAYEVDVRQKMIAVLLNNYIDSILEENSDSTDYRKKNDSVKIKDGLLVVLETLEKFKRKCIATNFNIPNNESENINVTRNIYVKFIVGQVYSVKPADVSHIMNESSFEDLLNDFLDVLKDIGVIDFDGNSNVIFLSKITYENSLCRLKKCKHSKDKQGRCLNENFTN